MPWPIDRLSDLVPLLWQSLEQASRDLQSPMRLAALGTANDLHASLRTVVLRSVEPARRLLTCHTDGRSAKVRELRRNPHAQWLFYHPQQRVQIIAGGHVVLHQGDAVAREAWLATPLASRVNYCTVLAPGMELSTPEAAWPKWQEETPTVAESEAGWPNFAVIECEVDHFDWLQLRMEGNRRAGFTWTGKEFHGHWLVP